MADWLVLLSLLHTTPNTEAGSIEDGLMVVSIFSQSCGDLIDGVRLVLFMTESIYS